MYLIKAIRHTGNHQYIIGVADDKDLAHFFGYQHCKFHRADKYDYTLEEYRHIEKEAFIISWETHGERLAYSVHPCDTGRGLMPFPKNHKELYRFQARTFRSLTVHHISEEDLEEAKHYWYFFEGRALAGLGKCVEERRRIAREEYMKKHNSDKTNNKDKENE